VASKQKQIDFHFECADIWGSLRTLQSTYTCWRRASNDSHSEGRQNSNVAHEIAHLLLGHDFTLPIDASGCRSIDRDVEDEANWLGPTLLIPNEAALHILCEEMDEAIACCRYGVTAAVLKMRINTSGARIRIARRYH
jgi:Zn-dependent peptidase ImmA (M78 family)